MNNTPGAKKITRTILDREHCLTPRYRGQGLCDLISCVRGLVGWLVGFLTSSSTTKLYRGRARRQSVWQFLRTATRETELGGHDFCLSRSHYTDTDPTSRERATTAGIEPGTSSSGVARSTDWATAPPPCVRGQAVFSGRHNAVIWLK